MANNATLTLRNVYWKVQNVHSTFILSSAQFILNTAKFKSDRIDLKTAKIKIEDDERNKNEKHVHAIENFTRTVNVYKCNFGYFCILICIH